MLDPFAAVFNLKKTVDIAAPNSISMRKRKAIISKFSFKIHSQTNHILPSNSYPFEKYLHALATQRFLCVGVLLSYGQTKSKAIKNGIIIRNMWHKSVCVSMSNINYMICTNC